MKHINKIIGCAILLTAIALMSGCATAPDKIAAAPSATGCSRIPGNDVVALAKLETEQRQNVKNDVTTTILLGVPLSKLRGKDHAAEIARLKACVKLST